MPTAKHRLDDGFPTIITFALDPYLQLFMEEKTVKPPGQDHGGPIDTTTMRNVTHRTYAPKKLVTTTPSTGTCAYDPAALPRILAMMGRVQQITYTYPDASTWTFLGWLDKFDPNEIREGDQPTAAFTVQPSNFNPTLGTEVAPAYTTGTSTTTTTTTTS